MRNEKGIGLALGLAVILGLTGCAGPEEVSVGAHEDVSAERGAETETDGESKDVKEGNDGTETDETQAGEWKREEPETEHAENGHREPEEAEGAGQAVRAPDEMQYLGGKVQSPQTDGMTLAQTTLMNEDNTVTLVDDKDAKKIPVRFTDDTKVEHWTISGGGAGIDMRDASVSDLEEGMGVELEGYYDGDTFVATRVIMEEYV